MQSLGALRGAWRRSALVWGRLKRERVPQVIAATLLVVILGATGYYFSEAGGAGQGGDPLDLGGGRRASNSLWWLFVTIFTEGYGDYSARTSYGRVVGVALMFSGVVLISLLTATIASVMVERRIREGRGLQPTPASSHIILCGWNDNAMNVLATLAGVRGTPPPVVLLNELEEDDVNDVKYKFRDRLHVDYINGDFTSESVLERAGLVRARGVIVLADVSGGHSEKEADERALRATLAAKGMAPRVPMCVEIIKPDNERPLRRARADGVVIRGCHTGYFLASWLMSPGVPQLLGQLLGMDSKVRLERQPVPHEFVGKTFADLAQHYFEADGGILIGLVAESSGINLDDILAGDMSSIDQFIRRKFAEAGQDLLDTGRRVDVRISPAADSVIAEDQAAIVITRQPVA